MYHEVIVLEDVDFIYLTE